MREVSSDFVATGLEPMLAPNKVIGMDVPLSYPSYPKMCSIKYNGIRALAMSGSFFSRTGKEHSINPFLLSYFEPLLDYSRENHLVLDGEFHSNSHNTVGQTRSILAGKLPLPDDFLFKCFYAIPYPIWNTAKQDVLGNMLAPELDIPRYFKVQQHAVQCSGELGNLIEEYKRRNIEGFMLLDPDRPYKHGRTTLREEILLKYKYYADEEDGKVIGLTARRERRGDVQAKLNAFDKAEAVYTKDSFVETNIAGCMVVQVEEETIYVPFPVGWTLEMRQRAYQHFGKGTPYDIEGEWICFRRLNCEDRDKPIAIKGVQFRDAKD